MTTLRPYQAQAVARVLALYAAGKRAPCLVAPTGAGKTEMAQAIIHEYRAILADLLGRPVVTLVLAHRIDLVDQTAARFKRFFPRIGVIHSSHVEDLGAPIQVASVQTCLARGIFPLADLLVLDECHHFPADEWGDFVAHYAESKLLGLTATPQRGDGRPLGGLFDSMVVAASYSELIRDGYLVDCRAYQPPEVLTDGIAADPFVAWERYAENSLTFAYAGQVASCERFAQQFRDKGVCSEVISHETDGVVRRDRLRRFSAGEIRVLWSVYALTEGVDIPAARCALFARGFQKQGQYLQAGGRPLRPAPGKVDAIIIDLCGSTIIHGLPTEDRVYSLDGDGIKRTTLAPLRNCPKCGATLLSALPICSECKYAFPVPVEKVIKIYDLELKAVFAGSETPGEFKRREFRRLLEVSRSREWSVDWAVKQYRGLFSEKPDMSLVSDDRRAAEYLMHQRVARMRGFKPSYAFARYKQQFGCNPPKWTRVA